jgi:large subunit ribosomal protein L4
MDGTNTGEMIELAPQVFGLEKNDHVLYLAVKAEMAHRRQGNHSTLSRSEVRGGGKKPWRQKGRGTARSGTSRSPIWRGGGIIFGPQPHEYNVKLPRKVKQLAKKIALSVKVASGSLDLVEDFHLDEPKTKVMSTMLNKFEATGKSVLLLIHGHQPTVVKSCRNIPRVEVRESANASTYDILRARKVIISKSALEGLIGGSTNA